MQKNGERKSVCALLARTQPPCLSVTLKFIYVWAECPGYFYCQDDLEEARSEVEQMWAEHLGSVLPSPHKYSGIVVLALLFLCLSTAKYWIMSFHTICPQASLKIHEWAILWGTGAIVCPSRPSAEDLTRNTWRGASVAISQTDLAEGPRLCQRRSNRGFRGGELGRLATCIINSDDPMKSVAGQHAICFPLKET